MRNFFWSFVVICLIATALFSQKAMDSSQTVFGYTVQDKDGDGITDTFQQGTSASDSAQAVQEMGSGNEMRKREGHLNAHGEHGKQLDRGASPHQHQ